MSPDAIRDLLLPWLKEDLSWQSGTGDAFGVVPPRRWREACQRLRDTAELSFDFLRSLAGVDRLADGTIEVVVHLFSYRHRHAFVLKTLLERSHPVVESLAGVWPAAEWHERELAELFGVRITGHPDLRPLLLPEGWVGHPLRKDYRESDQYLGIPTRRPHLQAGGDGAGSGEGR
jgi:NADH-quinone oxidoreductase subunit C